MAVAAEYPHLEKPPGEVARLARLPRIRVTQIVTDYLAYGWSADEICRQHSNLLPAEVHSALAYYFDHQEEIDAEIQSEVEEAIAGLDTTRQSAVRNKLRAKGLL